MNDKDLALLAEFAGGKVEDGHEVYSFPTGKRVLVTEWDLLYNWCQLKLVMEALRKKGYGYRICSPGAYTNEGLGPVGTFECWIYKEGDIIGMGGSVNDLGQAICNALLEVIKAKGKDGK